jgi:hypothetical protein
MFIGRRFGLRNAGSASAFVKIRNQNGHSNALCELLFLDSLQIGAYETVLVPEMYLSCLSNVHRENCERVSDGVSG